MISVCDLCDAHGDKVQVFDPVLSHLGGLSAFFGKAETIRAHEDNSRVREAVMDAGDGKVLVVDGGGSLKRSLLGGDLASKAANNGWSGVIINGAVRDIAELEQEKLGVMALSLIPMKTEKRGLGERNVTICVAGCTINPGDWIYADRDGVITSATAMHET